MIPLFCSELGLTCSKLADSVQQLKLPALLHIMDGLGYLAAWGLNVEFQAKTIDISISCRDPQLFSAFACICAALVGDVYMPTKHVWAVRGSVALCELCCSLDL